MKEEIFSGYVEIDYDGSVKRVDIYRDSTAPEWASPIYAYVDEELADDVDSAEEFASEYGRKLYNNMEDYKRGNSIGVERVWV